MRTSRIVTFAAVIGIAASIFGAAVFVATNTNDAAPSADATAMPENATLEPIVVVATK